MKHRTQKWIFSVGLALAIVVLVVLVLKDIKSTNAARPQTQQEFLKAVKNGLGTGCPFGGIDDPANVVNNLANFLNSRSGIALSQDVRNRLIALETQTMHEGRPRKTASAIGTAICDTWLERVGQLKDTEIAEIGECTRTAVDVPLNSSAGVMARAAGQLIISTSTWMSEACAYRDASTPEAVAARAATPGVVYDAVYQRLQVYGEALPGQWDSVTGYTPVQAFLLGYSMVTDDWLHQSPAALIRAMESLAGSIHQNFPNCQTSYANRKPYGYMGYLYSTHTPHLFSEKVQNRLIDRL